MDFARLRWTGRNQARSALWRARVLLRHLPKRAIIYLCLELKNPIISFKGAYYSKDIILHAYVRYDFFRDLEEILEKMGVLFDHAQCLSSNKDTQRRSKQLT